MKQTKKEIIAEIQKLPFHHQPRWLKSGSKEELQHFLNEANKVLASKIVSGKELKEGQIVKSILNSFETYKVIKVTPKRVHTQCYPNNHNWNIWKTDITKPIWRVV